MDGVAVQWGPDDTNDSRVTAWQDDWTDTAMTHRPVHWHEGMFLRPQHFQAAERFWSDQVATFAHWANQYSYGLKSIKISPEALSNFQIELASCQALMPDGTVINFGVGEDPDRRSFKQEAVSLEGAFDATPQLKVFLAVPRMRLGHRNVAVDGVQGQRFRESRLQIPDESSGGQDQEIAFRELSIQIKLSTEDLSGYETLPIAQIRRGSDEAGTPQLDDAYFPPMLDIEAWPELGRDFVRAIYDFLGQQRELLGRAATERGITVAAKDPFEVDLITKLGIVNEAYTVLRLLTFAKSVHPFTAYVELCRVAGKLAVLKPDRIIADAPLYDHDDLQPVFEWVREQIYSAFESGGQDTYEQEYFTGLGPGMHVSIKPKWFEGWEWYVGVARGALTEAECRQWLEPGYLNWKMGSAGKVDEYWRHGVAGLDLKPVETPPSVFPSRGGWSYFQVNREHPTFRHVQAEKSLAVRFSDKYIQNLHDLQGKRDLQVEVQGKHVTLQFALFALKRSGS